MWSFLFFSFKSKGATTQQHYRRNNGSFCLQAATPQCHVTLSFDSNVVIYNNEVRDAYKHRVNYDQKNLQWCLHQLSETDSGAYSFTVMRNDKITANSHILVVEGKGFFFCVA